ncbi:TKL/DRK protein kinase [Thecamonas trahens ATCC 50062]|uniref:TKL/DRK protein kinase n=1 Tax=Thecamonas trahens ATCC 50062 TaxID=461836 RepID=A0A0L0DBJ3_THETB|nr:TKL/DRK protein kinase [Thecamonas trahens ATCC 50062]KNC49595.1 TKL/DRK protein kinase [Thecamonas trahens ATCC 50062]|eukprot:XP_013757703.1 TKL/DRK protein kinase [Thecamonas trahens ATCC 50062]
MDEACLPMSSFLVVGNPKRKASWKLPYATADGAVSLKSLTSIKEVLETGRLSNTEISFSIPPEAREQARTLITDALAYLASLPPTSETAAAVRRYRRPLSPLRDAPIHGNAAVVETKRQAEECCTPDAPPASKRLKRIDGSRKPGRMGRRKKRIDTLEERASKHALLEARALAVTDVVVGKLLGVGASGEVRLARLMTGSGASRTGVQVAVKTLFKTSALATQMFYDEAALLLQLDHPNVLRVHGVCLAASPRMMVMEYVPRSLEEMLAPGALPIADALVIARGVLTGLDYLHNAVEPAIIHRDLKPGNILVDNSLRAVIADFGVSRVSSDSTMTVIGTPLYLAPEVVRDERYSHKVDMYSFGMVLYQMLTGTPPFAVRAGDGRIIYKYSRVQLVMKVAVEKERPKLPTAMPGVLTDIITSSWAEDPDARPEASALLAALAVIPPFPVDARVVPLAPTPPPQPTAAAAAAAAATTVVVGTAGATVATAATVLLDDGGGPSTAASVE